jgi:hypothetical protein
MSIDKDNSTQQERHQPLSLLQALRSLPTLGDLAFPVRNSISNSRQDPNDERVFLLSMLEQAIKIANSVDALFLEVSLSESADGEQEVTSLSHDQNQNQ